MVYLDEETITGLVVEIFSSAGDFGKGESGPSEEERKERCPHIVVVVVVVVGVVGCKVVGRGLAGLVID